MGKGKGKGKGKYLNQPTTEQVKTIKKIVTNEKASNAQKERSRKFPGAYLVGSRLMGLTRDNRNW